MTHSVKMKRSTLLLSESIFAEVGKIAADEGVPTMEILRRFVKLWLLVTEAQKSGAELIIKENGEEKHILIL